METNYNEIALLRRYFAALSERAVPTDTCFEAERIFDAARGKAPAAEVREIADHLVDCPVCAEAWRLARAIDYAGENRQPIPKPAPAAASTWMMRIAALLLLAVLGGNIYYSLLQPEPRFRDLQDTPVRIELADDITASRDGFTLRWDVIPKEAAQDLTYRIEIKTMKGMRDVAATWGVKANELRLDASDLRNLPAGTILVWQVEAVSESGVIGRSSSQTLRLR
ncbi:MAG TPA: hypothetical protein VLV83_03755 [Acidobacteriota bacterium]|nr:hypothetical protein [Acidobacteriota bacterium]